MVNLEPDVSRKHWRPGKPCPVLCLEKQLITKDHPALAQAPAPLPSEDDLCPSSLITPRSRADDALVYVHCKPQSSLLVFEMILNIQSASSCRTPDRIVCLIVRCISSFTQRSTPQDGDGSWFFSYLSPLLAVALCKLTSFLNAFTWKWTMHMPHVLIFYLFCDFEDQIIYTRKHA